MNMKSQRNKISLDTGASSGIGQATAELLAKSGYTVYGTSRRGGDASRRSFEMLPLDVTSDESVDAAVQQLMQREGRIDLLVNNAGFGVAPAGAEESSIEQAQSIFDTNFFGMVRMTRAVLPHMREQGAGRIINIGSVLGLLPMPYGALFIQAGSGGVGSFAIQLAKHLGATVATTTSTTNVALVKSLGADVVIDYKTQDFEDVLRDQDVVLNSQDGKTLEKSLRVLKRGGKLISISGPPDPEFGKEISAPGFVRLVMRLLSSGVRRKARGLGVGYSFLFMRASGSQLREITRLIEAGAIRPVMDRVFPFASTNEALAYVAAGRAKGKVVVRIK